VYGLGKGTSSWFLFFFFFVSLSGAPAIKREDEKVYGPIECHWAPLTVTVFVRNLPGPGLCDVAATGDDVDYYSIITYKYRSYVSPLLI
jgi:hypothetical protein